MKIGIIGFGFVGKAVASAYRNVLVNDPLYEHSVSLAEIKQCDAIFICLPTPESDDGSCDTSVLSNVLALLQDYNNLIIFKSTATPVFYSEIEQMYENLKLVHAPEFLTASNSINDYLNPVKIVIGCKSELREDALSIIKSDLIHFDFNNVEFCSVAEASMFKYLANTMLAIKVIMNNEYKELCDSLGLNWESISSIARTDPRLGTTHWDVPGPDGLRGFGGMCFPKDTLALFRLSSDSGINMNILETAINKNKIYRKF